MRRLLLNLAFVAVPLDSRGAQRRYSTLRHFSEVRDRHLLTVELKLLGASSLLGLAQIIAASHAASLQRGYRWTGSARDEPVPPLTGIAGRLQRSQVNFLESFPLFAALLLADHLAGRNGALTLWGAHLYFWGRLAYVPLYVSGIPIIRSLAWNVAAVGILLLAVALFAG